MFWHNSFGESDEVWQQLSYNCLIYFLQTLEIKYMGQFENNRRQRQKTAAVQEMCHNKTSDQYCNLQPEPSVHPVLQQANSEELEAPKTFMVIV